MDEEKWLEELLMGIWPDADEPQEQSAEPEAPGQEYESQEQPALAEGLWPAATINEFNNLMQIMFSCTELALAEVPRDSAVWHRLQHTVAARDDVKELLHQLFLFNHQIAETIVQVLMAAAEQSQSEVPQDSEMGRYLRQAIETGERARALLQQIYLSGYQITDAM
jgi:hypothetical protein